MNRYFSRRKVKLRRKSSNIQIYYDRQFPLEDIVNVFYPLFHADYSYDSLLDMINTADHIFCAYDETQRRCVGCALIKSTPRTSGLYISLFGVDQSSQQRGIGTRLLKQIIHWAYRTYHNFIYLHVHVMNYKAIGLYEKVGFQADDYVSDFYYATSKQQPDAYRMVLYLQ
ncbi:unnamed protein product [Rotaria sp. Silwood1]|nr:unnamed protein product [Rotaria sp. Silwood1]CAF4993438.1 unnamed protein product [Rotaria sp. Silwood1]